MRTTRLYETIKAYRSELKAKEQEFKKREKDLEDIKGSSKYNKVKAQIDAERSRAYADAKDRYKPEAQIILEKMMELAKRAIPMTAPSDEALRTLNLLEMRFNQSKSFDTQIDTGTVKPLTQEELQAALPLMGDNPTAIQALKNIAQKCGFLLKGGNEKGFSQTTAIEAIEVMMRAVNDIFNMPKIDNRQEYGKYFQMGSADPLNGRSVRYWRFDKEYDNADSFIEDISCVSHDSMTEFKEIINQ